MSTYRNINFTITNHDTLKERAEKHGMTLAGYIIAASEIAEKFIDADPTLLKPNAATKWLNTPGVTNALEHLSYNAREHDMPLEEYTDNAIGVYERVDELIRLVKDNPA